MRRSKSYKVKMRSWRYQFSYDFYSIDFHWVDYDVIIHVIQIKKAINWISKKINMHFLINESIKLAFFNLFFDRLNLVFILAFVVFFFIFDDRWINININIINIINIIRIIRIININHIICIINIINIINVNIIKVNVNNINVNSIFFLFIFFIFIFFLFIFFIFIFFIFIFFIFFLDVSFTINSCFAKNDKSCYRFEKFD